MTNEQAHALNKQVALDNGRNLSFPTETSGPYHRGLTKREYMATKILCAMITQGIGSDVAAELAVDATEKLLIELSKNK
jgi:hypothetical protein